MFAVGVCGALCEAQRASRLCRELLQDQRGPPLFSRCIPRHPSLESCQGILFYKRRGEERCDEMRYIMRRGARVIAIIYILV